MLCTDYAWLLATSPLVNVRDAGEAEVFARKAVELTGGTSHRAFDVLGAALAEAGRFDEAAEMAGKAISILDASSSGLGSLETRAEIVSRIGLYRSGQSFRAVSAAENESGN